VSQTGTKKGDVIGFGIAAWHEDTGWQHGEAFFGSLQEAQAEIEGYREEFNEAVTVGGFDVVITRVYAYELVEATE
jgi:hypothetical protein